MRRAIKLFAVLAVVVAAAGVGAWAQSGTASMPGAAPGETYLRADIWKNVVSEVTPLPQVQDEGRAQASSTSAAPTGRVSNPKSGTGDISSNGPGLPGSKFGSAFFTPSEKTTIEIKKVIKRLG